MRGAIARSSCTKLAASQHARAGNPSTIEGVVPLHQRLLLSTHIVRGQLLVFAVHIIVQVNQVVGSFPYIPLLSTLTPY